MITMILPMPPSVNALYANIPGRGRVKTAAYKGWIKEAGWQAKAGLAHALVKGLPKDEWWWSDVQIPAGAKVDADNPLKAIHDLLVNLQITPDDRLLWGGTYQRHPDVEAKTCRVSLRPTQGVEGRGSKVAS